MKLYVSAIVVALSACAEVTPGPGLDGATPNEPVNVGAGGTRPIPPPIAPITTCFAQGTAIATPTGDVPIERIRVGDLVQAFDFERRTVVARVVTATIAHGPQPVIRLETQTHGLLRVTPNHPIYVASVNRFVPAAELVSGARALTLTSITSVGEIAIGPVEPDSPDTTPVYDLTVEDLHNFFAEGVLVHNKERCWTTPMGCQVCVDSTSQVCPNMFSNPNVGPIDAGRDASSNQDATLDGARDARTQVPDGRVYASDVDGDVDEHVASDVDGGID